MGERFLGMGAALIMTLAACGSNSTAPAAKGPDNAATEAKKVHTCGDRDKPHAYDLHDEDGDDALVPCAKNGGRDYSGGIHIETLPEGVHITIHATDDEVDNGVLGSDVKNRDAVIVYPKGPAPRRSRCP